jgi:glycerol kinase
VIQAMIEDSGKPLTSLKVDGGASANNYLMQFQSDILNVPVDRPKMIEITALGAAMLAGLKAGVWTKQDIKKIREVDHVFTPKMDTETRIQKYLGWLDAIKRTKTPTEA